MLFINILLTQRQIIMKKTFLLSAFAAALCFYSCSNDDDGIDIQANNHVETKLVAERLSMNEPSISNPTLHDDWENVNVIYLNNSRPGQYVDAPWTNLEGNSIDIPFSYRMDIKKEDGWSMLTHNIMDIDYSGPNYILLYNKKRGELKGFYYNPSYEKNKSCVWVMEVQNGGVTSVFTSNKKNSNLMNKKYHLMTTSNIIEDDTFSFGQLNPGWNAFSFDLVYGTEDNAPIVRIYGYFDEQNEIKMEGKYSGEVAIPITKAEPSGAAKLLSKISKKTKNNPEFYSLNEVISASGTIFGNTSLFKSKTSVSYIRATSSGTIELTGLSKDPGRGTIPSINNIDLKKANNNEELGLWNFARNPTYTHYDVLQIGFYDEDYSRGRLDVKLQNMSDLIIAPHLKPLIKNYEIVNTQFFYESDGNSFKSIKATDNVYLTDLDFFLYGSKSQQYKDLRHIYCFIISCPSTENLYVNLTVQFEFSDGSKLLSSRNFKADFISIDSSDYLRKLRQMGIIVQRF